MMKRWITFILAISLCMTFLACSNQPAAQPNSADSDSDSGATPVVTSGAEEIEEINEGDDSTPVSTEDVPAGSSSPETESSETALQPTEKEETSDNPSDPEQASAPPRETEPSTPSQPTDMAKQPEEATQTEAPKTPEQPNTSEQPAEREDPVPTESPVTETDEPSDPPTPPAVYTQEDYNQTISEVIAYAESYTAKGFTFEWKEDMEFGWEVGYFGTPRIKYEGLEGTIELLKLHVDKIYKTGTDPAYGLNSDRVTYKVVQITIDGDIAFAVIYGG